MNNQPLYLLYVLTRALSHRLRTPLSVVSNDLVYYKTVYPDQDFDRGLNRCREISSILRAINCMERSDMIVQTVDLRECLSLAISEFSKKDLLVSIKGTEPQTVIADKNKLICAFVLLQQLFFGQSQFFKTCKLDIEFSGTGFQIKSTIQADIAALVEKQPLKQPGLSGFFNGLLGSDAVESPLIDAIFYAHRWSVVVALKGLNFTIEVAFKNGLEDAVETSEAN